VFGEYAALEKRAPPPLSCRSPASTPIQKTIPPKPLYPQYLRIYACNAYHAVWFELQCYYYSLHLALGESIPFTASEKLCNKSLAYRTAVFL